MGLDAGLQERAADQPETWLLWKKGDMRTGEVRGTAVIIRILIPTRNSGLRMNPMSAAVLRQQFQMKNMKGFTNSTQRFDGCATGLTTLTVPGGSDRG